VATRGADTRAVRQAEEQALVEEIREIHAEHRGAYGALRVHAQLRGFGHTVNRKRVTRLMRVHNIVGLHLRRKRRTTIPDKVAPPAPDLVRRDFTAAGLDENWCGDITLCAGRQRPALRRLGDRHQVPAGAGPVDGPAHAHRPGDRRDERRGCRPRRPRPWRDLSLGSRFATFVSLALAFEQQHQQTAKLSLVA
jgi:transposase InsO family protein